MTVRKVNGSFWMHTNKTYIQLRYFISKWTIKRRRKLQRGTFISWQSRKIFILDAKLLVLLNYGAESKALFHSRP